MNGAFGVAPAPGDQCATCDRRRDRLPDGCRMNAEIVGPDGTEWMCDDCRARGRGMK